MSHRCLGRLANDPHSAWQGPCLAALPSNASAHSSWPPHSFTVESEQLKEQWVEAMRTAIGEALSNSEVAEQIWAEPSNGCCADCGAASPDWASINLCVVVCKRCAGVCVVCYRLVKRP